MHVNQNKENEIARWALNGAGSDSKYAHRTSHVFIYIILMYNMQFCFFNKCTYIHKATYMHVSVCV